MSEKYPGSGVSDAMRALWARQARDDAWGAEQDRLRDAELARLKAEARAEQARLYAPGQARRRRR